MVKLSIIIVSWNVKEKLMENLAALYESAVDFDFEVFLVDNNSADGTALMVENDFPQTKLIANPDNYGFAKANNQAIKLAIGQYILLLNPDMRIFPDTLSNMVKWMDNKKTAFVAGCHLVDENNRTILHVRRFPEITDQLAIVLKLPHLFPNILNGYLRTDFDYSKEAKVDSVRGGFFMIRKSTIEKIGILDERFFVWFEEVDFCKRVKDKGGEVWYTPAARCIDHVGASFQQVAVSKKQMYFRESMLKYFMKWHPFWQLALLYLFWPIGFVIAWIVERLKIQGKAKT
jgi:GT2 family glycosyltransferase